MRRGDRQGACRGPGRHPRKGKGRANLHRRLAAGRGPKRFKDVLREQVLDMMHQEEYNKGEEEGQGGGGESISDDVPPKCGPLLRLEYDGEQRGLREAFTDGGDGVGDNDKENDKG